MGLLSFLKRDAEAAPPAQDPPSTSVQSARTRARQRLIGALVLLSIGVIGFPLLFESQPRPIPVDLPISIPGKDNAPPLAMPGPRDASQTPPPPTAPRSEPLPDVITETQADAGREVAPEPAASKPASAVAGRPATRPAPVVAPADKAVAAAGAAGGERPAPVPAPDAAEAARARALLNGQAAARPASQAVAGRYIVQIGAFADAGLAREARARVERLGLKTYTHVAETPGGQRTRVRVGPYSERAEAERAAARLRAAGLPAALLTL